MAILLVSSFAFIVLHIGVSGTPLREVLRNLLGSNGFLGLYSLAALASLGAMIYGYATIEHSDFVWMPSVVAYKLTKVILFAAIVLIVLGNMTRNPTAVNMEKAVNEELKGAVKITRHPLQWGILLFATGHLIANGDVASIIFFGTLVIVSGLGMISMDARKRKIGGEEWEEFFKTTSTIPFAATLAGRNRIAAADINWLAIGIGIALYVSIYWLHDMVSGGASLF